MIKFNKDLTCSPTGFTLLYPDRTEVRTLPGSVEPFTLQRYKEELGKAYGRLTLYLCKIDEFVDSLCRSYCSGESECDTTYFPDLNEWLKPRGETSSTTVMDSSTVAVIDLTSSTASTAVVSNSTLVSNEELTLETDLQSDGQQNADTYASILEVPLDVKECPVHSVILHRTLLKEDMIQAFKDPEIFHMNIDVTFIGSDGRVEEGKGDGVFRDALTTFWNQFFNSLTIGAQEKVPAIRHDYQKGEWQAIARILVYGYVKARYYPLSLSHAFLAICLFGEDSISSEFLLSSFRPYLSEDEREAFVKCLAGNVLPDDEDVLDFLSNYKCFRNPTKENIQQIVSELAHQEIMQKPRYVINCWSPILKSLKVFTDFKSITDLENMYDVKKPTAKKILKLIKSEPATDQERQCFDHLKKYIRSLQGNSLPLFLQFITGSDVISCPIIEVAFTVLEGVARRPVAHTCGPLLEIPSTYQSYNELSEEFSEILQQKEAWHFNIV